MSDAYPKAKLTAAEVVNGLRASAPSGHTRQYMYEAEDAVMLVMRYGDERAAEQSESLRAELESLTSRHELRGKTIERVLTVARAGMLANEWILPDTPDSTLVDHLESWFSSHGPLLKRAETAEGELSHVRLELEAMRVERDGWEDAACKALDEARRGVELLRDEQKLRAELERRLAELESKS